MIIEKSKDKDIISNSLKKLRSANIKGYNYKLLEDIINLVQIEDFGIIADSDGLLIFVNKGQFALFIMYYGGKCTGIFMANIHTLESPKIKDNVLYDVECILDNHRVISRELQEIFCAIILQFRNVSINALRDCINKKTADKLIEGKITGNEYKARYEEGIDKENNFYNTIDIQII